MSQHPSQSGGGPLGWLSRLTGRKQRPAPLQHPGQNFLGFKPGAKANRSQDMGSESQNQQEQTLDTEQPLRVTAVVQGTVQGVGFRYWTWKQAEKLGLNGSAVNESDGSVRVVAEGPRWAVRDLLRSIQGSDAPGAVFTVDAHYEDARGDLSTFTTG